MGSLKDLNNIDKRVNLLLTSSNLAEIYVYDTLKSRCKATLESVMEVNNANTFKGMLELVNVQPNLAENWLFIIKYSKVKNQLKKTMGIFQSSSSVFLIKTDSYKDFKEVKDLNIGVNDLYLEVVRRNDVADLLSRYKISPMVVDFVASSYYRDPEKVFILNKELQNGAVIESSKDVVRLCGESQGSIQKFVIQLLSDKPKSELFLKRGFKKRVNTIYDLCESFSPRTAYNFIKASIKDVMYIKMLYLEGKIYDRIKALPEGFDEKRLSKYNFNLRTISEDISYNKIIVLYGMICSFGRWVDTKDAVSFLYQYYLECLKKEVVN